VVAERDSSATAAELRTRKGSMDQETARLASLNGQVASRQRDLDSRATSLEAKTAQLTTKELAVGTELQRAENLMEDLAKKDRDLATRDRASKTLESELSRREAASAARDAQLTEAMRTVDRMREEAEEQRARVEEDRKTGRAAREDAEKLRSQADAMQAEVSKNLRFLQKKALDVLDREEKLREKDARGEELNRSLDTRAEILEGKERALESDRSELTTKTERLQAEVDRMRTRLTDMEKTGGPSSAAMEEWKKDMENRVKIIQKKAMELLDREEKLRKKQEELDALAQQLGVAR
jgi:chromosome segregation ATPase